MPLVQSFGPAAAAPLKAAYPEVKIDGYFRSYP